MIKEDLVKSGLLFCGTEFGLWISIDGGQKWGEFKGGDFPSVAVRDLQIHPRENDLVIATHGRGIWIVDDLTPLRALSSEAFARHLASLRDRGCRDLVFLIGGPDGLAPGLKDAAQERLAFGPQTWPHLMVRAMLAEQIYRAFTILSGHPYHRGRSP